MVTPSIACLLLTALVHRDVEQENALDIAMHGVHTRTHAQARVLCSHQVRRSISHGIWTTVHCQKIYFKYHIQKSKTGIDASPTPDVRDKERGMQQRKYFLWKVTRSVSTAASTNDSSNNIIYHDVYWQKV